MCSDINLRITQVPDVFNIRPKQRNICWPTKRVTLLNTGPNFILAVRNLIGLPVFPRSIMQHSVCFYVKESYIQLFLRPILLCENLNSFSSFSLFTESRKFFFILYNMMPNFRRFISPSNWSACELFVPTLASA